VDRIHVDPLHVKNNACALAHRQVLKELFLRWYKDIGYCSSFANLPPSSPFVTYVETLRSKCNLARVANKVVRWFDDSKGTGSASFDYRFNGKDSRMFLHNFMFLIDLIEEGAVGKSQQRIHAIAYACLCLRESVSLFSRLNITDEQVSKLKETCNNYFRTCCVFLTVNPTVWTIGHIVPSNTEDMKTKYGMGLGLNSMEGREAKHISISKFNRNTFFKNRWEQIFRHEYVSLIWLGQRGFNLCKVSQSQLSYIPSRTSQPTFCYCGFDKEENFEECRFCCHSLRQKIMTSIRTGIV